MLVKIYTFYKEQSLDANREPTYHKALNLVATGAANLSPYFKLVRASYQEIAPKTVDILRLCACHTA